VQDRIQGYQYVDHSLRAFAGQRLVVALKGSHAGNTFNVLAPGAISGAMAIGEREGNRYEGVLPDDGVYTVRVYLPRAAGRRNESSRYTLSVGITGVPLKSVSSQVDAVVPGTRVHATTTAACVPPYTSTRTCEAQVVRRGFDGTATVLMRWDEGQVRRILFVKGQVVASDAQQAFKATRTADGWLVEFGDGERYEVPEPLVMGG
jgi:hypothetical protein